MVFIGPVCNGVFDRFSVFSMCTAPLLFDVLKNGGFFFKKAICKSDPPPLRKAHTPNSPPNAEKKEKERGKKIGIDFFATRAAQHHSSPLRPNCI